MSNISDQLKKATPQNLSLLGAKGPNFENEGQRTTSDIQALANNQALVRSQDMLTGRRYGRGKFPAFAPPSSLDNSAKPVNGLYTTRGPKEGRY